MRTNIVFNGKSQTLKAWSRDLDIPYGTLVSRYNITGLRPPKLFDKKITLTNHKPKCAEEKRLMHLWYKLRSGKELVSVWQCDFKEFLTYLKSHNLIPHKGMKLTRIKNEKLLGPNNCRLGVVVKYLKHGKSYTKEYKAWADMVQRCTNTKHKSYKDYGGRGIKISKSWMDFNTFYTDMGIAPDNYTLDRKNNNKGYNVKNCRWVSKKKQVNNRRNNIKITYEGKTRTISQWARVVNLNQSTLYDRIVRSNWEIEDALFSKPIKHYWNKLNKRIKKEFK